MAQLHTPHAFAPSEIIPSGEFNANFAAIEQAVNHIEGEQILDGTLTSVKFADLSITNAQLGPGCVHKEQLYQNVVYSAGGIKQKLVAEDEPGSLYVNVDGTTLEVLSNALRFNDTCVVPSGGLAVDTTAGNTLKVALLGITNGMLAPDCVTTDKIAPGAVHVSDCDSAVYNGSQCTLASIPFAANSCYYHRLSPPADIVSGIAPIGWTRYNCGSSFTGIPSGKVLMIVYAHIYVQGLLTNDGAAAIFIREPDTGTTPWPAAEQDPAVYVHSLGAGIDCQNGGFFLVQTNLSHEIEYEVIAGAGITSGHYDISIIGYICQKPR